MQYIQCNRKQLIKRFTRYMFTRRWCFCSTGTGISGCLRNYDIYGTWFVFNWILSIVSKPHLRVKNFLLTLTLSRVVQVLKQFLTNSCRNLRTSDLRISVSWIDKHITLTPLKPSEASGSIAVTCRKPQDYSC